MKKLFLTFYIFYLPFQLKFPSGLRGLILNVSLAILFFILISCKNKAFIKPKFEKYLIFFLIIWFCSFLMGLFNSIQYFGLPAIELTRDFKRLSTLVLGYFVFSRCIETKKESQYYFMILIICIIFVGIYTLKSGVLGGMNFADHKRSSGPFGYSFYASDIAGGFLAIFTPFVFSFFLFTKRRILKLFSGAGLGFCVMGLLATYSRGSMLALIITFIIMIVIAYRPLVKRSRKYGVFIFACVICMIFSWKLWVPESIITRVKDTTEINIEDNGGSNLDDSSQMRIQKWKNGLDIFYNHPMLGIGFRQLQYNYGTDPHNSFVQIAAEMGIFGILFFFIFLFYVFKESLQLIKMGYYEIGVGFVGAISAFGIVNMFYSNFFRDTVIGTFWIVLGLLASCKNYGVLENDKENKKTKQAAYV